MEQGIRIPKLHFSGFSEAMQYISGQLGDSIPVIRADGALTGKTD